MTWLYCRHCRHQEDDHYWVEQEGEVSRWFCAYCPCDKGVEA